MSDYPPPTKEDVSRPTPDTTELNQIKVSRVYTYSGPRTGTVTPDVPVKRRWRRSMTNPLLFSHLLEETTPISHD